MECRKIMVLLALVVFLLSIAGVSASEIGDTIASENANTIELSADNDIEDNLQTSEENEALASTDYDEAIAQTDTEVLGADSAKYSDLAAEISQPGNIKLNHKNYTYDGGEPITISEDNKVIDGNGAVIDMNGSTIGAFHVSASDVTIKNLTIKNANYDGPGGAIYFSSSATSGTVSNCNFADNTAYLGGAVYFNSKGEVTNCNFTNNTATYYGGAVYFENNGEVTNCNFVDNKATGEYSEGGAINMGSGTVSNCNFTNNAADYGGAVYFYTDGNVTNCNFTDNNASEGSAIYFFATSASKSVSNSRFLNNRANAEALEVTINDNNITITFTGQNNLLNAIYSRNDAEVTFTNVTYWGSNGINNTGSSATIPSRSNKEAGQNITLEIYDSDSLVDNVTLVTDDNGQVIYDLSKLCHGKYTYKAYHLDDSYYTHAEKNDTFTKGLGDFNILQSYINAAEANSVLTLDRNYTFTIGMDENLTDGIVIDKPITINGNGYTINALQKARIFKVTSGNVVLNNITFTNATASNNGGAVYFSSSGSVTNCNFTDNTASGDGGAVHIHNVGTVTNCNFTNNKATGTDSWGGAIYIYSGTVTNCNFTANQATVDGGAIYFAYGSTGNVTNCNFTDNTATQRGGAIYFSSSGTTYEVRNCNFTNNTATYEGGAVYFNINGEVTNCNFVNNSATGEGSWGGAIRMYSGTVSNCNFTDNSATVNGGAVYFNSNSEVTNCNFVDNKATGDYSYGGAVYFYGTGSVTNCNFTNNTAYYGGAIWFTNNGDVVNCNFIGNNATYYGGAVYFLNTGNVTNCNFTGNNATTGSAISFYKWDSSDTLTVSNSTFLNNRANAGALDIVKTENNITITFTGQNNLLNAIYSRNDAEVTFNNVTYWGANGIATVSATMAGSNKATGQNITVGVVVNGKVVLNEVKVTDENGMIVLDITAGENYYISVHHDTDSYYTEAEKTISNNTKFNANVTSQTTNNKTVNITAKSNIKPEVMPGKLLFILPNGDTINATYASNGTWWAVHTFDDYGDYQVNASYIGFDNVTITNATISIVKANSTVNVSDVVMDYGDSINVTVTAEGAKGINATIDNKPVTVINNYTIMIPDLAAGNYTLTVTTIADDDHKSVNKTVNVTVNKAHTEITINTTSLELIVGDETIINATLTPAGAGNVTFTSSNVDIVEVDNQGNVIAQGKGQAIITVSYAGNNKYAAAENRTITVTVSLNDASVTVDNNTLNLKAGEAYAINATKHPDTIMLDITYTSSNSSVATVNENGIVTAVGEGTAVITVEVGDDEIYAKNSTNVTVTVSKVPTEIGAKPVTATYNINKNLVITLKDANGNPVTGVSLSVDLNGAKKYTTDKNGQVKVSTKGLDPKTYTAKITFNGNAKYAKSSKNVKVTVKKATPKLTAKKKTYKTTTKTKKYTIVLKDNVGKAIKKAKVTLKVKGKTYKAKTNSKGKATFKIKNLKKKGTFKAVIKYKGNKYYKKLTKKAKIKVIVKFKTVSRGSKDKATVKEIQQALKDHGYYLTYQGHYLKIDGKFSSCTVRSIKQFQHDKGLKPTGKVDEKTAIKLGILK